MVDALKDYQFKKGADATSLNSASLNGFPAFVRFEEGSDSTGQGVAVLDSNADINDKTDIGLFDDSGNPLDFYWVTFDTGNGVYEAWVSLDLVRDGTLGLQVGYGGGSTDDSSPESNLFGGYEVRHDFQETSGDAIDSTSNNRDGTVTNVNRGVSGMFGKGYDFNASDSLVKLDGYKGTSGSTQRTAIFWFKTNTTSEISHSWIKYGALGNNGEKYYIRGNTDGGNVYLRIENEGGNHYDTSIPINDNNWHMLAVVFPEGASDVRDHDLYIDAQSPSSTSGGTQGINTVKDDDVHIGNSTPANQHSPADGVMDEVQMIESELSADYIQTHYDMSDKGGYSLFSWNSSTRLIQNKAQATGTPQTSTATAIYNSQSSKSSGSGEPQTASALDGEISTSSKGLGIGTGLESHAISRFKAQGWSVTVGEPARTEREVTDVYMKDAFNRFAREADVEVYDPDGSIISKFPRQTPVVMYYSPNPEAPWTLRFGGFVSEIKTDEDFTNVQVLGHDFWLRKAPDLFKSYSSDTVKFALEDIVTRLTPIKWVEDNIDLNRNPTFTRNFKGDSLEDAISEFDAIAGGNHEWGVNDKREFFFRQREQSSADVTLSKDNYLEAEFDDDTKRDVNDVTIYFGEGNNTDSIRVQDREQQKQLAEKINSDNPVKVSLTKSYPEIESKESARNKAEAIIESRSRIKSGDIKSWAKVNNFPGEVVSVSADDQDNSGSFRIAEVEHTWSKDETKFKVAENIRGVEDELVNLSDEVKRIDNRAADKNATVTEYFSFTQDLGLKQHVKVYERSINDTGIYGHPQDKNSAYGEAKYGDRKGSKTKLIDTEGE